MNTNILLSLRMSASQLISVTDTPDLEAEILLAEILGVTRTYLHTWPQRLISTAHERQLKILLAKRLKGQPLAYILGQQVFSDLLFYVNTHTLIPRPETEVILEIILEKYASQKTLKLLELGTGCGAIAITLAKLKPAWQIVATDISQEALFVAQINAKHYQINNIQFYLSDWFSNLPDKNFDVIVSNPPYIACSDPFVEKNVLLTEPKEALLAGPTGLEALTSIILSAAKFLAVPGYLILEHGFQQGAAVRELLKQADFYQIETFKDLSGKERVAFAKLNYF